MSKRTSNFTPAPEKRPKLDELSDLWGDEDFDSQAIEDCFLKATQVETTANVTLLPSYNSFRQGPSNQIFTSTQGDSSFLMPPPENLDMKLKRLEETCREKDGENSILRANLQRLREKSLAEQEKRKAELKVKISSMVKENQTVRSELEFKNLEVMNLKQRLSELTKVVQANNLGIQKPQISENKKKVVEQIQENCNNYEIHITSRDCILKRFNSDKVFDLKINEIYPEVGYLIKVDLSEVTAEKTLTCLAKVQDYLNTSLAGVRAYLKHLETGLQLQEIQHQDSLYLADNNKAPSDDISDKKIAEIPGELLKILSHFNHKQILNKYTPDLKLVLEIVQTVGNTRVSSRCSNFFAGLLKFMSTALTDDNLNLIFDITREVLLSRPDSSTVVHCTYFLMRVTRHVNFCDKLCVNVKNSPAHNNIMYFSKKSCVFQVYVNLLENMFVKDLINLPLSGAVLSSVHNIIRANSWWIYMYKIKKNCDCLHKLYEIAIETIYKTVDRFKKGAEKICPDFLRSCIKIMSLLIVNSDFLVEKHVVDFARFKEVVDPLDDLCHQIFASDLEQLNFDASNVIVEIPKNLFMNAKF